MKESTEAEVADPTSFAFRLACYENYHWTPDIVRALPMWEAQRLAIWFAESGAHYRKEMHKSSSSSYSGDLVSNAPTQVVGSVGSPDEEWAFEEE